MCPFADPTDENQKSWALNIASVPREKAGAFLDHMQPSLAAAGLNLLIDEVALDLLFYASESTFDKIAGDVKALD